MIDPSYFRGLIFPWRLYDGDGNLIEAGAGTIFSPYAAVNSDSISSYCARAPEGFSRDPLGFAAYKFQLPDGSRRWLVLYGLHVQRLTQRPDEPGAQNVKFTREQVLNYIHDFLAASDEIADFYRRLLRATVHEIRSVNTDMKAISEELIQTQQYSDQHRIDRNARSLKALGEIISARMDVLDLLSNPQILSHPFQDVDLFRKFDKVRMSLEKRADSEGKIVNLTTNERTVRIEALPVFEVVPYILVDNAIKYAPQGTSIVIGIQQNDQEILVIVENWGPTLDQTEQVNIFELGYRGRSAVEIGIPGTGVGLFTAKRIVEADPSARLTLFQEQSADNFFVPDTYRLTRVTLKFPRPRQKGFHDF